MKTLIDNRHDFTIWLDEGPVLLGESGIVVSFSRTAYRSPYYPFLLRIPEVKETVVFHQLRLRVETSSSEGEMHDVFIKVYAEQTYARAQYARSQRNELFVLRALVARGRAKATSRTALWLKWLLAA